MARVRTRKPKTETVGQGVPRLTEHEIGDIPIGTMSDRWRLFDWKRVYDAVDVHQVVSMPVPPNEVHQAIREGHYQLFLNAEGSTPIFNFKYDEATGRLWWWNENDMP